MDAPSPALDENPLWDALCRSRGWGEEGPELHGPENPEPLGTEEACALLREAHVAGAPVVVAPDFDMDGVSAGACLFAGLSELGFDARLYAPDASRGYGLKPEDMDEALSGVGPGALVVTCDGGITAAEAVGRAHELGARVLVTDHHRPGAAPCGAEAVVDPYQEGDPTPFKDVCGAHVAWSLLVSYANRHGTERDRDQVARLQVLAGLGTVSDSMPMDREGRADVKVAVAALRGLCPIAPGRRSWQASLIQGCPAYRGVFFGLEALLGALMDAGRLKGPDGVDEDTVGFYMAPMVNSVKRLGLNSAESFDLFFGPDPDAAAANLLARNEQRKLWVEQAMGWVEGNGQPLAPHVWLSDAPGGVLGLVAQRLVAPDRPVLVVAEAPDGSWSGSGRAPSWYPMRSRLLTLGVFAAGHEQAFGFRAKDTAELELAAHFLEEDCRRALAEAGDVSVRPDCTVSTLGDGDSDLDPMVLWDFMGRCRWAEPFGPGVERPLCALRLDCGRYTLRTMGDEGRHLRLELPWGVQAVWFGGAEEAEATGAFKGDAVELLGEWRENEFRGDRSIQFVAKSARAI